MSLPFTRKQIASWGGMAVFQEADALAKRGGVLRVDYSHPEVTGSIARPAGPIRTGFTLLDDGTIESHCPCYANREQGLVCCHVTALAIALFQRFADPERDRRQLEEQRRARRIERQAAQQGLLRSERGTPCRLDLRLPGDWKTQFAAGRVCVDVLLRSTGGNIVATNPPPPRFAARFDAADENLCCVIEDIAEGFVPPRLLVGPDDFLNLLDVRRGRCIPVENGAPLEIHDETVPSHLQVDLDRENGELLVFLHTDLPSLPAGEFPEYFVAGRRAYALGSGHLWPLRHTLPLPYHSIYREPVALPRLSVLSFFRLELPTLEASLPVACEVGEDLFTCIPGKPLFRLRVRGSQASLAASLDAVYGDRVFPAGSPVIPGEIVRPDPDDILRFFTRNEAAEAAAVELVCRCGFPGRRGDDLAHIVGCEAVLGFLANGMPTLRRHGWQVEFEGTIAPFVETARIVTPVVSIREAGRRGFFDASITFEDGAGGKLPAPVVQHALQMRHSHIENADGSILLFDRAVIEAARSVFDDCDTRESPLPGHFLVSSIHAPFVRSALGALDGVDIEEPPDWRLRAERQNRDARLEPVPLEGGLEKVLRPYQKEGVSWLRFLERGGFGGILADEMGLGKTLQTLAWLRLEREDPDARGLPSIVVCPTSLVENWAREAKKFTPDQRVLVIDGPNREKLWASAGDYDLVLVSYGLVRRDIDLCDSIPFAAAVLDEAHNIKNRETQSAAAVKRLRASAKLVLTGTPIENSVADLWSIMDFLMPGYLQDYLSFRDRFEVPIIAGGSAADAAQDRLRRKLHPFLLRRVKRDVAKDLPEKIVNTSFCTLTEDQQRVYNQVLQNARSRLGSLVAAKGFDRCRMEILAVLLRLRQVCCHLDLLPEAMRPKDAVERSAKLDQFLELFDEAVAGGHRLLVFSQFTSMLAILRRTLEERGQPFCYLDGSTTNRLDEVQRYNRDPSIPAFLISLKAGGVGLNLTGADMVVHFDPWWNPAVEDQATDRAHRIGQKRTVYSIKLIAQQTIEEKVLALQQRKQALIRATVGTSDDAMLKALSWRDVQELLADVPPG
ncbi:MAG: DEAD/DEAH box helicase [Kiritimatiellia bacterium]|jgi:hypothetical protein